MEVTSMEVTSNLIFQGSEYATHYEYVWVPNMPGFIT